jgi:hypothetical protein
VVPASVAEFEVKIRVRLKSNGGDTIRSLRVSSVAVNAMIAVVAVARFSKCNDRGNQKDDRQENDGSSK